MSIEKLTKTLEELRLLDRSKKKGCTEEEIRILEAKYNIKLPDSYKSFLMEYGHGGSNIVDDKEFEYKYDVVLNLTEAMTRERNKINAGLAAKGADKLLPMFLEKLFFIASRYGEQLHYVIANNGRDCEVFYYDYYDEVHQKISDSIWDWLEAFARDHRELLGSRDPNVPTV